MVIFNTTYAIHRSVNDKGINFLKTTVIPSMLDDGFTEPVLMRINQTVEPEYTNYALQFRHSDPDALRLWMQDLKPQYDTDIRHLFHDKILSFSTIMHPIEL